MFGRLGGRKAPSASSGHGVHVGLSGPRGPFQPCCMCTSKSTNIAPFCLKLGTCVDDIYFFRPEHSHVQYKHL